MFEILGQDCCLVLGVHNAKKRQQSVERSVDVDVNTTTSSTGFCE